MRKLSAYLLPQRRAQATFRISSRFGWIARNFPHNPQVSKFLTSELFGKNNRAITNGFKICWLHTHALDQGLAPSSG